MPCLNSATENAIFNTVILVPKEEGVFRVRSCFKRRRMSCLVLTVDQEPKKNFWYENWNTFTGVFY